MYHQANKMFPELREHKWFGCAIDIKSLDERGVFAGYASVFHVIDSQKDMILPGAFARTVMGHKNQVKLLWQHDMREPIGVIEDIREDANGLYVKGRLLLDVGKAREAYTLIKEGVVSGLSIGYSLRRYKMDPDTGVRLLQEVDLWEISLVTFPANDAARISVVKGEDLDEEEQWRQAVTCGHAMRLAHELERAVRILSAY